MMMGFTFAWVLWLLALLPLATVIAPRPAQPSLRDQFIAFDNALAALGVPPLTAWWRDGIGRWLDAYESAQVLDLVAAVGRGAAKSTAMYKLALFFTLFGPFAVPRGERHWAIVLSRLKEEAAKGIEIIAHWLTLLGVPHHVAGDVIELDQMPRGIRVVAASVAAASGWRAFFVAKDERSKWPDAGVEERVAEEIDTSASAMTATHALAPILSFGSAWVAFGGFFDAVKAGSDAGRVVLGPAPTWVAAPHITEADCRRKERVESRFRREYACEFVETTEESFFPVSLIDRARRAAEGDLPPERGTSYVAAMDPSLGRNAWTLVIAGSVQDGHRKKTSIVLAREWRMPSGQHFDMADVLARIARIVGPYADTVYTDQFHGESLAVIAERLELGITIRVDKPTAAERIERYESLLTRMSDDGIELHADPLVRRDLLSVKRRFTPGGFVVHLPESPGGRHADYVPAIVLAVANEDGASGVSWAEALEGWARGGYQDGPPKQAKLRFFTCADGYTREAQQGSMLARWRPNQPTQFSESCSEEFIEAVAQHRAQYST
jgi:hypothetical protein